MAHRPEMPGALAFGCAMVAHGLVAVALVISYGHNQHVADSPRPRCRSGGGRRLVGDAASGAREGRR